MTEVWLPAHLEVEQHILGALFLNAADCGAAFERLKPADFGWTKHGVLFDAARALYSEHGIVDMHSLMDFLGKQEGYDREKGFEEIRSITSEVVSTANIAVHVRLVKDAALRRRMIIATGNLLEHARNHLKSNAEVMGEAESLILSLAEEQVTQGLVPFRSIIPETLADLARSASGQLTGVPTGLKKLDEITGGLHPTDFIVLAGRPAMGKTGLGLSVSWRSALHHGTPTAFFSMEMGKKQLQQRVFCAHENLDLHKLRQGKLSQEEMEKFKRSVKVLENIPLHIDDANGKTPLQILSQCKRMKAQHGLKLIVVDFCQLGKLDKEPETRQQEVGDFAYALKGIAKELDIPVLGLAQLNRECEKRSGDEVGNFSYKASDLNESGKLEQAADIIGVIHRPEVLSRKAEVGLAQLQVIKFRNGPTGDIDLRFNAESASFSDYIPPSFLEGAEYANQRPGRSANSQTRSAPPRNDWGNAGPPQEPWHKPRPGESGFDD